MSKHTPGPLIARQDIRSWRKNPDGVFVGGEHPDHAWAIYGDCQTVTRPNGQTVTNGYRIATVEEAVPGIERMNDEVVAATAHLLAAAPALLAAAKAALDLLNGLDECEMLLKFGDALYIVEQLDAAIAAADPDFVC